MTMKYCKSTPGEGLRRFYLNQNLHQPCVNSVSEAVLVGESEGTAEALGTMEAEKGAGNRRVAGDE